MNDFREYKNYLMHYGVKGMKWNKHIFGKDDRDPEGKRNNSQHSEKERGKEVNALLRYAENPNWAKYIKAGEVDSVLWNDCISIVKNRNYNDSQKKAMINAKLRLWFNGNLYENSEYYAKKNGVTK